MGSVPEPHSGSTKGRVALPAGQQDQRRRQRLVERAPRQDRPIAALVQRLAGAFQAEHGLVAVDVQVEADHRLVHVHARPPAAALDELIADGVLGRAGRRTWNA